MKRAGFESAGSATSWVFKRVMPQKSNNVAGICVKTGRLASRNSPLMISIEGIGLVATLRKIAVIMKKNPRSFQFLYGYTTKSGKYHKWYGVEKTLLVRK